MGVGAPLAMGVYAPPSNGGGIPPSKGGHIPLFGRPPILLPDDRRRRLRRLFRR